MAQRNDIDQIETSNLNQQKAYFFQMEFVNNSKEMDVETKSAKRDSDNNNDLAKSNLLITPKKNSTYMLIV